MTTNAAARLKWPCAILVALLGIAYVDWLFFTQDRLSGGSPDTVIQIALLQNWSNCLAGYGDCLAPNYFFPLPGTLGYNDGYLISGLIYHAFRIVGFDPFVAYECVYIIIRLVGFAAVIALGRRVLRLPFWAALLAAWFSLIAINLVNQVVHTQLIYAAFVPLGLLLLIDGLDRIERLSDDIHRSSPAIAAISALGFGAFAAVWAVTAFYSFFYSMFFCMIFGASLAVFRWQGLKQTAINLVRFRLVGLATVAGGLLAPIALWIVYGATLKETGGHEWYAGYHPRLQDLLNVGPANIWTPILDPVYRKLNATGMVSSELATGFPPLFLICAIAGIVGILRSRTQRAAIGPSLAGHPAIIMAALAIAASLSIVTVLRIGSGYTLSYLVWKVLPGASAVRVPARFLIFVTPVACLIVADMIARFYAASTLEKGLKTAILGLVIVVLTVEQFNSAPVFELDRQRELAFLKSVPPAPEKCRAFYVSVPRNAPSGEPILDRYYIHSVDAMLIAALRRIPTLNGIASFQPKAWNLEDPFKPDYAVRVEDYAARLGIADGLCSLNLQSMQWASR